MIRGRAQRGFTLLEILAAFVIFALAFASVLQILSGSLRNTMRAADYTQAALWAQSKLDLVGIDPILEEGSDFGRFDDKYSWTLNIEPYLLGEEGEGGEAGTEAEDIGIDLFLVQLDVSWGEEPRRRTATFKTMRSKVSDG